MPIPEDKVDYCKMMILLASLPSSLHAAVKINRAGVTYEQFNASIKELISVENTDDEVWMIARMLYQIESGKYADAVDYARACFDREEENIAMSIKSDIENRLKDQREGKHEHYSRSIRTENKPAGQ